MDTSTGPKQVTFLTEKGLYKVLFKSRKPIAEKFQNWVCEIIKEIRLKGVYDLQKQLEQKNEEILEIEKSYDSKIEIEKALEKQRVLLNKFGTSGSLVYIIRVKTYENGEYIIKIGHSEYGVKARYAQHKASNFDECLLLDCFPVQKSKNFEQFLHNHSSISCNNVKNLQGHESETELFLIGKEVTYNIILNIISKNIQKFNENDNAVEILNLECQKLQLIDSINGSNSYIQEILNTNKILLEKMAILENQNKEILEKLNASQTKTTTGFNEPLVTLGPRLQKIHPETLQLVKVYESISEAMKENNAIKRPSINKAIIENTIYCGFRWLLVERNIDPNIIHNILPTKQTKAQYLGYIAKLNSSKTEIIDVYLDRKTAAHYNGYESSSALDTPVKKCSLTKGHYYKLYQECEEGLKESFIHKNKGEPILYKNGVGQCNEEGILIKEFECKYDCIKMLSMSYKTLAKALDKNVLYNGYYFKMIGSKLKCL